MPGWSSNLIDDLHAWLQDSLLAARGDAPSGGHGSCGSEGPGSGVADDDRPQILTAIHPAAASRLAGEGLLLLAGDTTAPILFASRL